MLLSDWKWINNKKKKSGVASRVILDIPCTNQSLNILEKK